MEERRRGGGEERRGGGEEEEGRRGGEEKEGWGSEDMATTTHRILVRMKLESKFAIGFLDLIVCKLTRHKTWSGGSSQTRAFDLDTQD
eukprot:746285-Hanusia_phi.AAC.5